MKDKQLRQSMSRKGNCWDNAPQESFFGHMKDEIDLSRCKTFNDVKVIIDYYNNERYQWNLTKLYHPRNTINTLQQGYPHYNLVKIKFLLLKIFP